jgi:hypothetical protein
VIKVHEEIAMIICGPWLKMIKIYSFRLHLIQNNSIKNEKIASVDPPTKTIKMPRNGVRPKINEHKME